MEGIERPEDTNFQFGPRTTGVGRGRTIQRRIYNSETGRPTDKIVKVKITPAQDISMDEGYLPIDPSTGEPLDAVQQPLPEPRKKRKGGSGD